MSNAYPPPPPPPPPPGYRPAVFSPPPRPAPAPARSGWRIVTVLLTIFLLMSVVGNLILFFVVIIVGAAAVGGDTGGPAQRVLTEKIHDGSSDILAVMPLSGDVDETMAERAFNFCEYIKKEPRIRGVVVEVDSPGGGITAADEIHHLLTNLKATRRRVVVSMRSLAASGGYYISLPADKIYAEPTTLTGSIGVIWPAFEVSDLMKKVGVTPEIIKSSASNEYKDAGSPFRPFTEKDRDYIRGLVNNAQTKFSDVVDAGRKGKLTKPVAEVAIGKVFTADEALALGLVDEISYLDEVCDKTATDLGLSNPTIVRLKERSTLFGLIGAATPPGGRKVEVNVNPRSLEQFMNPKMQYRMPEIQ